MTTDVNDTLAERGGRYGAFTGHAVISQTLQKAIHDHAETVGRGKIDDPVLCEALAMICHKLGRIANGDPAYDDSWRDIAGYAMLVVKNLNGESTE